MFMIFFCCASGRPLEAAGTGNHRSCSLPHTQKACAALADRSPKGGNGFLPEVICTTFHQMNEGCSTSCMAPPGCLAACLQAGVVPLESFWFTMGPISMGSGNLLVTCMFHLPFSLVTEMVLSPMRKHPPPTENDTFFLGAPGEGDRHKEPK